MPPSLGPQAIALTTAIAAVSGTIIFLVWRLHKSSAPTVKVNLLPSSCVSSVSKKKQKKKRVRFAESVIDATGPDEEELKEEAASPTSG